jgi:PIN domain nuclease of toxin-antitoxin system
MKLPLDTHLLRWAAGAPQSLPSEARTAIEDSGNMLWFRAASLWEIAIKRGFGRPELRVDPRLLRQGLLENGYAEPAITGADAVALDSLPPLHKDPFDRILVVQAMVEGLTLMTSESLVAAYPGPIRRV